MKLVNDTMGHVIENAEPHSGIAELLWAPITRRQRASLGFGSRLLPVLGHDFTLVPVLKIETTTWDHAEKPPFSWLVVEHPETKPKRNTYYDSIPSFQRVLHNVDHFIDRGTHLYNGVRDGDFNEIKKAFSEVHFDEYALITLYVFAAPNVKFEKLKHPTLDRKGLTIKIIRVPNWDSVPKPGRNVDLSKYIGNFEIENFASITKQFLPVPLDGFSAQFNGNILVFKAPNNGYEVKVELDEFLPSHFHVTLDAVMDRNVGVKHTYYIGMTKNVKLSAWQGKERYGCDSLGHFAVCSYKIDHKPQPDRKRYLGTLFGLSNRKYFNRDENIKEQARAEDVPNSELLREIGRNSKLPEIGFVKTWDNLEDWVPKSQRDIMSNPALRRLKFKGVPLHNGRSLKKVAPIIVDTVIGLTPVLGTIYDLATIGKIAATGTDFWGEKKTSTDMLIIGTFVVLGSFGEGMQVAKKVKGLLGKLDKESYGYLERMKKISEILFPNAKIVSMNPGHSLNYLWTVISTVDPVFAKAAQRALSMKATRKYVERLEEIVGVIRTSDGQQKAIKLIKEIAEAIEKKVKEIADLSLADIEEHPAFILASGHVLIDDIVRMKALRADKAKEIEEIVRDAVKVKEIEEIVRDAVIKGEFEGMVAAIRAKDELTAIAWKEKTRQAMIGELTSDPLVQKQFINYKSEGGTDELVGFALNTPQGREEILNYSLKTSRGKFRAGLNRLYGVSGFEFMLGKKAKAKRIKDIEEILDQPGVIEDIKFLLNKVDTFEELTALRAQYAENIGKILEIDHLIEGRIRIISFNTIQHTDYSTAMLVPKNIEVANALLKRGIDCFLYIHLEKTSLMRSYIPHGQEMSMPFQSIIDAYQKLWVHDFKMSWIDFERMFGDEFSSLAIDAGVRKISLAEKSIEELNKSILAQRIKMGKTRIFLVDKMKYATRSVDTP